MTKRSHWLLSSILLSITLLMTFAAYCNTLNSPFYLDDYHSFVQEPRVHIKELSLPNLATISETQFGWERYIPMLTFALNYRFGGDKLVYLHLGNIVIHGLTFLALLFFLAQLKEFENRGRNSGVDLLCKYAPFWIAGLWVLHPVQTNAVTYLVQRMAAIQTLFYFLSVGLYISGRKLHMRSNNWSKALPLYAGCALASLCAFLSKQNSAMLPFMILVTEMWFFQPDLIKTVWRRMRRCHWGIWLLIIVACAFAAAHSIGLLQRFLSSYDHRNFTLAERLYTEARIVVWYASLLLCPLPSRLSLEYDVTISRSLLHPPTTLASIAGILLVLWLAFRYRRRFPVITYGTVWFFMNLIIESTIIPLELVFVHRLYLPSAGFFIVVVFGIIRLIHAHATSWKSHEKDAAIALGCSFAVVFSVLTLLTFIRNEAWENPISINYDNVLKAPFNPRAHANLGSALAKAGAFDEAIKEAEKALELGQEWNEEYTVAANTIVLSYLRKGDIDEAIRRGEQLLADRPESSDAGVLPELCLSVAEAYRRSGQLTEAYSKAQLALKYIRLTDTLPKDYWKVKKVEDALITLVSESESKSVDLDGDGRPDPGESPASLWLANQFLAQGERGLAKGLLQKSLAEQPEASVYSDLLESLQAEDRLDELQRKEWSFTEKYVHRPFSRFNFCMAVAFWVREKHLGSPFREIGERFLNYALQIRYGNPDPHLLKGWYYYERNELDEAVTAAKRSLELHPEYAKAWLALGFFFEKANQSSESITAFQRFLQLFPGYSHRLEIQEIIARLQRNVLAEQPIASLPDLS